MRPESFLLLLLTVTAQGDDGIFFPDSGVVKSEKSSSPPQARLDECENDCHEDPDCRTLSGVPCVFPFKHRGVVYHGCTSSDDPDKKLWCSTNVTAAGEHIVGSGYWGHCNMDGGYCPYVETFSQCTTRPGASGECKPVALCVGISSAEEEENECEISQGRIGVCCADRLDSGVTIEIPGFKFENVPVKDVTDEDVNKFIGSRIFVDAPAAAASKPSDVDNEEEGDPESLHLRFNIPVGNSLSIDRTANDLQKTAEGIKEQKKLSDKEAGIGLRMFDSDSSQSINRLCPWTKLTRCVRNAKYRTMDGTCNNLKNITYGQAGTPYQRILTPQYAPGSISLPRRSVTGAELPSARLLSVGMTAESNVADNIHTLMVMQMGQFVDHDLTSTPTAVGESCCGRGGRGFASPLDPDKCFPIEIPREDPFWQGRKTCMSFLRSLSSPGLKCEIEFRQQQNQITHWLDGSNIYGSSADQSGQLREFRRGLLKMTPQSRLSGNALPSCSKQEDSSGIGACGNCGGGCYFAGDARVNEHALLVVMHTIWMREHNRVARLLRKLNTHWDDERLFQESRRIVVAQYQHIVYKEWMPLIIGTSYMNSFELWPLSKGYSNSYMDSFDPRITNEFAGAGFRFGHSLVPETLRRTPGRRGVRQGRTTSVGLAENFFNTGLLRNSSGAFDDLVRGMADQEGMPWDNSFVPAIQDHLFDTRKVGGLDLVALNIQRGRDHGLPGYNAFRKVCQSGSGEAKTWSDLEDIIPRQHVLKLKRFYSSVDDVDLYVAGFLERAHGDSILGPTFKCIVGDQFARLKMGDRFFYDLGRDPDTRFTPDQLQEIRKTSMARILCDNTRSLVQIQPQVFRLAGSSSTNQMQNCRSRNIPAMNLGVFSERPFSAGSNSG